MNLIRSDVLGYCMGVRKAVQTVLDCLENDSSLAVYTYGPLIHNPSVLKDLEQKGVKILSEPFPSDLKNSCVIIRAHGISPLVKQKLIASKAFVVDATCPRVLSSQKRAESYYKKGYQVILAGDKNHGEITGIAGFAPNCIVLENPNDAKAITSLPEKSVLISQTTIKKEEYDEIACVLLKKNLNLIVCDTICPATSERQTALEVLSKKVEGIIVIGGKNSANTMRLFLTAKKLSRYAWLVENSDNIPKEVYSFKTLGITAGASTPDEVIASVENKLRCNI